MINTLSASKDNFYRQMLKLTIPIIIQNLLSAAVNSADVIMLNYVGQSAISAVSLAANYSNILFMVYYGLGTGASLLCAQYFGKNNMQAIHAIEGIALRFSIIISGIVALIAFTASQLMMKIFTSDQELISIGSSYLRIMGITYLCWGITEIYLAILRSIGRVTISMALNMLIVSFLSKDVKLNLTFMFIRSKVLFGDFVRLSLPALGNDISWSVAFSMYSVILGHLGTDAVAANSLVTVVRNIGSVFCFAIASAGTILLGNVMGKGNLEKSKVYASRMLKMTIIAGAIGGVIVFAITPLVLRFASLSDGAMHYLKYMLLINTYYIMGSAVNTALIAGVFRAGGDTKFGLICDTIDMWVYAVPLGFFAAFVLKLPVLWVYFLLCTDEFVKWPWVFHHYRQGKWAQNITREDLFEQKAS